MMRSWKFWAAIGAAVAIWAAIAVWASRPKSRDNDGWTERVRLRHYTAVAKMDRLLRLRGDVSRDAERRARREQLFLVYQGLSEEEALGVLEAFAEHRPEGTLRDWIWAAHAWHGRRPQDVRGPLYTNIQRFVVWFCRRSREQRYELARSGLVLMQQAPGERRRRFAVLGKWHGEANLGLVASPNDKGQDWSVTLRPDLPVPEAALGAPPGQSAAATGG